ncbi:MAG: hypothetical protein K2P99_01565, partial [Burkholderiales bacterium]|nr:hypothetical protein [Burkholderiales bacterium]
MNKKHDKFTDRIPYKKNMYFGIIAIAIAVTICIFVFGYTQTWDAVLVPTMAFPLKSNWYFGNTINPHIFSYGHPVFGDMRVIQGSIDSYNAGFNPHIFNPGDPWGRLMNYP